MPENSTLPIEIEVRLDRRSVERSFADLEAKAASAGRKIGDSMSKAMSQERQIDKQLNTDRYFKQAQAIDSVTAAMQKQNEVFKAAGVRSPQDVANELKALRDSKAAWEALGPATEGYKGQLDGINRKINILTEGNARARGSFHKMTAAVASLTFELTGALYGLTAIAGAIGGGALFGISTMKRIEDARTGITGILVSMASLNGKALEFGQAWQVSGQYVEKIQQDSLRYGIDMGRLTEVNQAALSGGLTAMLTLEQIQKVATAGAIAVSSLGLNSQQYVQEVRDLISGGIQPASSTLARSIGVTDALLKQWKAEGPEKLIGELTSRLQGFLVVADEVRTKTLTGSWEILQARLGKLLSDEEGFGAIKKAVLDVANYIGDIDVSGKFQFNPEALQLAQSYWDQLKSIGSVLWTIAEIFASLSPIILKVSQFVAMATIQIDMLFTTITAGFNNAKESVKALLSGDLMGFFKGSDSVRAKYATDMESLSNRLGRVAVDFFGLGEAASESADKIATSTINLSDVTGKSTKAALNNFEEFYKKHKSVNTKYQDETLELDKSFYAAQLALASEFSDKMVQLSIIANMKKNVLASSDYDQEGKDRMLAGLTRKEKAISEAAKSKALEELRQKRSEIVIKQPVDNSAAKAARYAAKEDRDLLKQSVDDYKAIESALNESVANGTITYIEAYNARIAALNSYIAANGNNNKLVTERNKTETELVKFTDDLLKKSVDLRIKYYGDTMSAGDAYMAEFEANSTKERKVIEDTIKGIEDLKRELSPSETAALVKAKEALLNFDKATDAAKRIKPLADAIEKLQAIEKKYAREESAINMQALESGGGALANYNAQVEILNIRNSALQEAQAVYDANAVAIANVNNLQGEERKKIEEIIEALNKAKKSYLETRNAMDKTFGKGAQQAFEEYKLAAEDTASQSKNLFSNMFKNIEDAFTNFIMTGKMDFKSFVNGMIADLARMAAKQIVLSFAGSFGGMFGGAGGVAGAAGSAGSSMLSSAAGSAAGNLLGGTISGAGMGAIASGAAYGTGFMSQQSLMLLAQESTGVVASLAEVGSTISGALSAIPGWGWALAGGALLAEGLGLFGEPGGPKVGASSYQGAGGVMLSGEYQGETFNRTSSGGDPFKISEITTASINQISGLASKFGKTLGEEFAFGLAAEFDPEGTAPGSVGYILGDQKIVSKQMEGTDVESGAKELMVMAQRGMIASLAEIDLSPVVDPLLDSIPDIASLTEQQAANILKIVTDLSETSAQSLDDLFGEAFDISKFEPFKQEGELTIETFGRLANVFSSTNVIAEMLGQDTATAFGEIGLASADMRQSLIDGAGGIENLGNQATFFYQNFYTEAERASIDLKKASDQVGYAFAEMGIAIPESDKAFRDLVEGLDLGTEAGQKMYQSLMDIAPAFIKVEKASKASLQSIAGSLDKLNGGQANTKFLAEQEAASTFNAVQAAMPWITSIEQLATITLEDAANYSSANQQLIAAALEAEAAVNGFSESVAETTKAITENNNVFITSIGEVWDSARQKVDEIANTAANIVGESPTSTVSDKYMAQIAAIQQVLEQAKTTYAAGTTLKQGSNTYELYLSQAQKTELEELIRYSNERIAALKGELEQYAALEAMYPGHGEALQDLEKWYKTQKETLMSTGESVEQNMLLMEMLEKTYQEKRNAILNDGISEGLENAKTALRKWIDSVYFNEQLSPLTAQQKFEESQSQYVENLMKAQGGDVEAISNFQKYAEEYLKQAKNMYGFGGDYSAIWQSIMEQAGFLAPELVMIEDTSAKPATTNDIAELTEQVNELKEVLARVMEKGNTITQEQTTQLVSAIRDGSTTQARATTNAATVQSRT